MGVIELLLDPFFKPLLALGDPLAIASIALVASAISSGITAKFVDHKRLKELQKEVSKYSRQLREAYKAKDKEKIAAVKKDEPRFYQLQSELMKMQFPMFYGIIPVIFIFSWLKSNFEAGAIVQLPFIFPLLWRAELGWLGWYILCSLPMTLLVRKLLRIG